MLTHYPTEVTYTQRRNFKTMALFIDSTQATHWTLSSDQLSERRARTTLRISERLQQGTKGRSQQDDYHDHDEESDTFDADDEAFVRVHHERRILQFIRKTGIPEKLGATAVSYFKRFFVDRSVTEYNPSVIALSALYAAGKVEEIYLTADRLVHEFDTHVNGIKSDQLNDEQLKRVAFDPSVPSGTAMRVSEDALLRTELQFLQHLQFHLVCYHGFRSLGALREVLKQKAVWSTEGGESEKDSLRAVYKGAHIWIAWRVPLTELMLTETPAVLALAAVAAASVDEGVENSDDDAVSTVVHAAVPDREDDLHPVVHQAVWTMRQAPRADADDNNESDDEAREYEAKRRRVQIDENDPMSERFGRGEDGVKRERSWSDDEQQPGDEASGDGDDVRAFGEVPGDGGSVKRRRL